MKVAILGYGTVGQGIGKILGSIKDITIEKILDRKEKNYLPNYTDSIDEIISNPEIEVVFECLNGIDPADRYIRKVLESGKTLITSNKAVVANNLSDYIQLTNKYNSNILIEACVAGGIPFIDEVLRIKRYDNIKSYRGIFNGTTNYILEEMTNKQMDFEVALRQAQELGYAEKDPSNDILGTDVYYKCKITNMLITEGITSDFDFVEGIKNITKDDIEFAKNNNLKLKLLGTSYFHNNEYASFIAPSFIPYNDYLANVDLQNNAQLIETNSIKKLGYYGPGAGMMETANSMVSNLFDYLNRQIKKININKSFTYNPTLIKKDWIIKTKLQLDYPKLDNNIYVFKDYDLNIWSLYQKIKNEDLNACIGMWGKNND